MLKEAGITKVEVKQLPHDFHQTYFPHLQLLVAVPHNASIGSVSETP